MYHARLHPTRSIQAYDNCVLLQSDDELVSRTTKLRILKSRYTGDVGLATNLIYDIETGRLTEQDLSELEPDEQELLL